MNGRGPESTMETPNPEINKWSFASGLSAPNFILFEPLLIRLDFRLITRHRIPWFGGNPTRRRIWETSVQSTIRRISAHHRFHRERTTQCLNVAWPSRLQGAFCSGLPAPYSMAHSCESPYRTFTDLIASEYRSFGKVFASKSANGFPSSAHLSCERYKNVLPQDW